MRALIITLLLFVLPQVIHGSTYTPQVNGQAENAVKSDATKQIEMKEAGKIPIHCPPAGQLNASEELKQISKNSIADCPADGAIKNHPGDGKGKMMEIR